MLGDVIERKSLMWLFLGEGKGDGGEEDDGGGGC